MKEEDEFARRAKLFHDYMNSPEMQEKLLQRLQINDASEHNLDARAMTYQLCVREDNPAEGCIFFIENFGWTFDPRKEVKNIPFILYDFQKDAIRQIIDHIDNGRDLFLEKSRDMGITWVVTWVFIWYWLFRDGSNLLLGSYKEKLVDDGCYTEDTEVLTMDGWKLFQDIDYDDLIATRNQEKKFQWQHPTEITLFQYEGEVYNLKSRTLDLTVSPNHRVVHSNNWGNKEQITLAKDLRDVKNPCLPATSSWEGGNIEPKEFGKLKMSGLEYAQFMGMYLAEGSCGKLGTKNANRVQVYQQKYSKGYEEYKDWFNRILGRDCYYDRYFKIGNVALAEHLRQFGKSYEKFIPDEILNSTKEELEAFLYFYMLGDGCWKTSMPSVYTSSKKMADGLQELIQKVGKSSSISTRKAQPGNIGDREFKTTRDRYELRLRTSDYQSVKVTTENYSGQMGCVTVPNKIIYVRRKGKPAWSGNTDDSLFGRLDISIRQLPKWLWPRGFNPKKHRTKLKIINPVNNNLLAGDTMNPDFGRGSRKTAIFFDELGFWDYAEDAWSTCGDTTACRIANSTPNGRNFYADLRETGIDIFTMHWTSHPLKDDQWYAYECERRSEEEVAQEIDISYTKSQEGRVYKEWNEQNIIWGHYDYDNTLPLYVGWDFGKEDPTTIIWAQPRDGRLYIIDTYTKNGENIDFFIPFITGILPSEEHLAYRYNKYDLEQIERHKNWKRGVHFGDPAGRNRNQVNDATVLSVLREHGIVVNYKDSWKVFQARKRAAKQLIRDGIHIHTSERNKKFAKCMDQASYPTLRKDGVKEINSVKPKHDWTSHFRSAFEYLALGLEDYTNRRTNAKDTKPKRKPYDRRGRRRALSY